MKFKQGVYISRDVEQYSKELLQHIQKRKSLSEFEKVEDLHCTAIYHEGPKDIDPRPIINNLIVSSIKYDLFGDCLVMLIDSPELERRFKELSELYDFESSYPEYKPHITICKGVPEDYKTSNNFKNLPLPTHIVLGKEIWAELDVDHA